jgi:hypothetical protein
VYSEFNATCFGEGGPTSICMLMNFYEEFNATCVG